jgi:hypothetical protein
MRGGRFIHGGESGDHSNPLFLIWSGLRTTPPGAVSFTDCAAHCAAFPILVVALFYLLRYLFGAGGNLKDWMEATDLIGAP